MKLLSILAIALFHSCSSLDHNEESKKLTQMWMSKLSRSEIIQLYGTEYKQVEKGISYQRSKSTWPKFAFFFDEKDELANQFALLDEGDLEKLKENLNCNWEETQQRITSAHAVQFVPRGKCKRYSFGYEFKKDWGLYEVKWLK